ncbi:MAG: hypothetical protein GXO43_06950 [Crenarchaeota archaeon]|nr:hypothetical protein [Thermoproteota archaeon]
MYRLTIHIHGECREFWDKYNGFWKQHSYDLDKHSMSETRTHIIYRSVLTVDDTRLVETAYQNKQTGRTEKIVFETPSEKLYHELKQLAENTECVETNG